MLFLLPAERAKAAADPVNDTYVIENRNISSVSLQYKAWDGWHNVTASNNHTFSQWEEIGFYVSYNIPAGEMAELSDNATITYQVQGITKNDQLIASSGDLFSQVLNLV
ncbi:MAG: hypothetical protein IJG85_00285 [Eubacteriaceae bacterium]|nr:hypothetical protein [Eubacteriaceae bacterium]